MSGIFGCWQLDGRRIDAGVVDRCLALISPHGSGDIEAWVDGSIALGAKATPDVTCRASDPSPGPFDLACAFDGRIDNRDDLFRCLPEPTRLHPHCADRELTLAAYERFGDACVEYIHGDFAFAIFDRRGRRLLLARDRLGLRPLCYSHRDHVWLFASEAKALLSYPGTAPKPDELMLADFALYFRAADSQSRTFFEGIQSLPPAHVLIATADGVSLRRYFDFDTTARVRFRTVDEYARAFHDLFRESVRARLRCAKPVAISVSGGLDSSYIFCLAQAALREGKAACPAIRGINFAGAAGTSSEEEHFVRELERATGAPIDRVPQRAGFMACAEDEVRHSESPIVEGLACQGQAALRRARESGAGRFLTGHWGDQLLSDSDYLLDLLRRGQWAVLGRHCRGWRIGARGLATRLGREVAKRHLPEGALAAARRARRRRRAVFESPWYTARFRALLSERASHAGQPTPDGTRHAAAIYQQSRLGYHVQCMEWNARVGAMHGLEVAFPYLDCALIQFLMSIPGEIQSHDGVPRGLMRQAMRGTVPEAIIDRRSKGEFTQLTNQSIDDDFAAIAELLGPSAWAVRLGYIEGPVLWKLLPEWRAAIRRADDAVLTNRIVDLCGLELLLREFFSTEVSSTSHERAGLAAC
jgi:asparagine synthase (glutamine-hydrolysing)